METELDRGSIKSIKSFYNYTVHSLKSQLLPYVGYRVITAKVQGSEWFVLKQYMHKTTKMAIRTMTTINHLRT